MSDARGAKDPFGAVLRHLVENTRDLTVEDVAMVAGVDRSTVSRYLSGQHPVPLHVAVGLARIGMPQLLEEACARAGGRYDRDGVVAQERVDTQRRALGVIGEVMEVVHEYVGELTAAARDGVVDAGEHERLLARARDLRTTGERLERAHRDEAVGDLRCAVKERCEEILRTVAP